MSIQEVLEKLASLPVPEENRLDYEYLVKKFVCEFMMKPEYQRLTRFLKENDIWVEFFYIYHEYKNQND